MSGMEARHCFGLIVSDGSISSGTAVHVGIHPLQEITRGGAARQEEVDRTRSMKIISIYVSSLDGRITKDGRKSSEWASREDQIHYRKVIRANNLIVMGSTSYNEGSVEPTEGTLHIVMTREPQRYKDATVPGQLEFTAESPEALVERLEAQGYQQMLLVSGPRLATSFFERHLVDEFWLTLEPEIFGRGPHVVTEQQMHISLQLADMTRLNHRGTLLLKYNVLG